MPFRKIFIVEQQLRKNIQLNEEKLTIIDQIKDYLSQIDHKVEQILKCETYELQSLLFDLKGSELSLEEQEMVHEICDCEI